MQLWSGVKLSDCQTGPLWLWESASGSRFCKASIMQTLLKPIPYNIWVGLNVFTATIITTILPLLQLLHHCTYACCTLVRSTADTISWPQQMNALCPSLLSCNVPIAAFFHPDISPEDTISCITTFLESVQYHTAKILPMHNQGIESPSCYLS